jgi:nitrogen fixation NifU-like protein
MARPEEPTLAAAVAALRGGSGPATTVGDDPSLAGLYQELILGHYRKPRHKGALAAPTHAATQKNPLCGDELTVQLQVEGDTITDAAFDARGCSISQATASMLLDHAVGRPVGELRALVDTIDRLVESPAPLDEVEHAALGDLRALHGVSRFPARRACVRLVLSTVREALGG